MLACTLLSGLASFQAGPPDAADHGAQASAAASVPSDLGTRAHLDRVMTSAACADCHPVIYAEHQMGAHGRAFIDPETRIATRGFQREDCVRCHTPRPIFETGPGLTPMKRWTDLEDGNSCMSCHWKKDYDYSRFEGGKECKVAFDPRVGTVQACASCHRIAGTPDQWSHAEHGQKAGNVCIDCHMGVVERPVAVGEPPRPVHPHVFPAAHSESQLRRAYAYSAEIQGNEVVVRIKNKGVGHNFPTANRQRAVESLVTVRDAEGKVIGSSRLVCRYPYASELEPGQLTLPVGSQIPSGQTREHRVPIPTANGTVECSLFFKLYRPIPDFEHGLSRRLEYRVLPFEGLTPSAQPIRDAPIVGSPTPASDIEDFFDPHGVSNFAHPPPSSKPIDIPAGKNEAEIQRIVSLLEFHMPEARKRARQRLLELGPVAYPALVRALGVWSNETFNQAIRLLASIGDPALPALREALESPELYVRCHARDAIARMAPSKARSALAPALAAGLERAEPLDRRSAISALAALDDASFASRLRPFLDDPDWDVVSAAAQALARFDDRESVPAIERTLLDASFVETKLDLARALCELGSPAGVPILMDGLDEPDEMMRAAFFEALFAVTGLHACYDPGAAREDRLEAIARLREIWARQGSAVQLRRPARIDPRLDEHALELVMHLGGGTDTDPGGDDAALMAELESMGSRAVPALLEGLTFPPGFPLKRELVCRLLGRIGDKDAAPFLAAALRDPELTVCDAACTALEATRDPAVLPALSRYQARLLPLLDAPTNPGAKDRLLARAGRTALALGDEHERDVLVQLLFSPDRGAREIAIGGLESRYGDRRGFDAGAPPSERATAAARWTE